MKPYYRQTAAFIDLDALAYNIKSLYNYHQNTLIAIIKANAYGHGDVMVAKALEEYGVHFFGVATLDEALNLRLKGITSEILVLGYVAYEDLAIVLENNLTLSALSYEWIKQMPTTKGLKVHMKVNTGLNRYGIDPSLINEALALCDTKGCEVEGLFTHFISSDEKESPLTPKQYQLFVQTLENTHRTFKWIHTSNSGAVANFPTPHCNAVRIGLSLYGYSDYDVDLKPVMRLVTHLHDVKKVEAGSTIGYNATYITKSEECIGTLSIGYADGFNRFFQGAHCYVEGSFCEFVGRISMDLSVIKLDKEYPIGTEVELLGPHLDIHKLAEHVGTIPYEFLVQLNDRIPRVYLKNKEEIAVLNPRLPSPEIIILKNNEA